MRKLCITCSRYEQNVRMRKIKVKSGEWMVKRTRDDLMAVLFGGNRIEEVGGTERVILRICREILNTMAIQ
jgi:hypothetical protein